MTRNEFLKMSALLGVSLPFQTVLTGCRKTEDVEPDGAPCSSFDGSVIIIGAGPAGMSAGHFLAQQGISFTILEANSTYGGRIKTNNTFADFPISLGAEWLHVEEGIFSEIINDAAVTPDVTMIPYDMANDYALYNGQQLSLADIGVEVDQKFLNASWLDFYEAYVLPSVAAHIEYNKLVTSIDYSGDQVVVEAGGQTYSADKVIVAVPVKILQNDVIAFNPALPADKAEAISQVTVWKGCKGFIRFTEKFYPAFTIYDIPETSGEKLYYDAAYGQNSGMEVLGYFGMGTGTEPYVSMSDSDRIAFMLEELDELFDGQASANYVDHLFQNWIDDPYANGAYVWQYESPSRFPKLQASVNDKLFFAGDAYTNGSDWSSVHTAARSARQAVAEVVG